VLRVFRTLSDFLGGTPTAGHAPLFLASGEWTTALGVDVDARSWEPAGDGVTDDTAELQAALTAGAGKTVRIPASAGFYLITTGLVVPAGTTVVLDAGTVIEQATKAKPVFDCLSVDDVTIEGNGALLRYTGSRTFAVGTTTRGDAQYVSAAGVWSNGNRTTVRNLRVEGLTCGVHLSGWNGTALTAYAHEGNVVENLLVDTVDFGLLYTGQSGLRFAGIRGTSVLSPGSTNPSHVIYASHGARSRQISGADCEAWDVLDANPFQFKGQDGGTVKNLTARNCVGVLSIGGVSGPHNTDLAFSNVVGRDLLATGGNGAVYYQGNADLRVRIDGLSLHLAASDRAIRLDGIDNVITNVKIRSRHDVQSDTDDVLVLGTRNGIDGISIVNIQDDGSDYATAWRGIALSTGTDCFVRVLGLRNVRIGVETAAGATNPQIDLSQAAVALAATSGLQVFFDASASTKLVCPPNRVSADNGDAARTLTALVDATTQRWATALTGARAVTLSTTGAHNGARFRIVREAAATGASALNVGAGPLKALAAGQWCDVIFDGSAWRLVGSGSL
jgi:hypothetical protein